MGSTEEARGRKMAMNESAFRTANERLRNAALGHRFLPDQRVPFICECADDGCYEVVMLRLADYEQVRQHPKPIPPGRRTRRCRSPPRARHRGRGRLRRRRKGRHRRQGGRTPPPARCGLSTFPPNLVEAVCAGGRSEVFPRFNSGSPQFQWLGLPVLNAASGCCVQ
jgi:hypothetical protein